MSGNRLRQPTRCLSLFLLLLLTSVGGVGFALRADEPSGPTRDATPLKEKAITNEDREHWAFVPPSRPELPEVRGKGWARNPIDRFVLARLEEDGLAHAPEADRSTLLRRVTFDLTGLPPTPEELDAFLVDKAPDAFERVVDRLLASAHYGERWAQHWLDLARYADTDGFEFDQARPDAWRYRDWVVGALNDDMPYDEFVRRQLAGDEIAPDDSGSFVATGFNRCYPDMVDLNDQKLRRQNALNDITETTGLVFLGLTVGCARCHDHKFDPIRLSDFYRLQAFFAPARFRDDYPVAPAAIRHENERQVAAWTADLAALESAILSLEIPLRKQLSLGLRATVTDDVVSAYQKAASERTPQEVKLVFDALEKDRRIKSEVFDVLLGPDLASIRTLLRSRLRVVQKSAPTALPQARGLDEVSPEAPPTYLLRRGDFSNQGPEIDPGFPAVLTSSATQIPVIRPNARTTGRRTKLAEWLLEPQNPLTGRVMVNRIWQRHFGRGIVATASDFGTMGAGPSHPELLDWLATEFIARGWSIKAMHRLMLTSATYRQSSRNDPSAFKADPENNLLWRHARQRLDGEAIRDALLAVSNQLNLSLGGPCVFPELPAELTKLSSHGAVWPVSPTSAERNRRSLYVFVRRNLRYPFFEAFDRPDTNASCPVRSVTTIAPQALSLMNSKLALDAAHGLASRIAGATTLDSRIERAYRLTLGRMPRAEEIELARRFLTPETRESLTGFCLALLNVNEFVYLD
ncbi:DUF1549 and DUF1553 domain-containing protein [Singulisphaera acidiphila]|uniref:Cytochrome c domain-containing protein n=1 Tax=Singulisphaera acidiphila (strain ATCC BAA-1392 / DSM 18658 / VKM B-2454 / MOB10) TaxID=886293 RepID=L0DHD4_SINAD|nr:DUF1549 and DUF1553 domain-containing protein [Singulisphaera acidiphila]AGA28779.1 Protein of unknown function (DUF1553)/Protein of unknown function (DUF1549) [Singulisphaera acidiphila DSM 18658]